MRKWMRRFRRDEGGMTFVFVGLGFMAFMAASTLAIDVGMFMTARSQAQNAADSGALAGAVALYYNNFNDRTSTGPAVTSAISAATANLVMAAAPSVLPADVTFPNDPAGHPTRVAVSVFRTTARNNAIPTLIGPLFGVPTVSIGASATAEASQANAETCVKPFTIPDKWTENQDPGGWSPDATFDQVDNKGKPLANPDVYIGPDDPANYTGYNPARDKGIEVRLKADNKTKLTASFYNPWDLPGSVGGNDYRNNISGCNTAITGFGQNMPPENGNMVGPTKQGMDDLIAKDPNATWDTSCNCVKNSAFGGGNSPRITVIPVYDPVAYADGQAHGKGITLTVTNYIGMFIEQMQGNEVYGRIMPLPGLYDGNLGPAPAGAFPVVIRLVQ